MPGPNGAQGRRRANQSRVGQPRDQDGRPQGAVERRGGRTYRPGLHDWTPAAPGRGPDRTGDAAAGGGRFSRPARADGRPAPARPGQPRGGVPRPSAAVRPGSMGGAPAPGAAHNETRPTAPRGAARPGSVRPWQPGGPPRTGALGGRTRYGSEEPRDGTDRSRYGRFSQAARPRTAGPASHRSDNGLPDVGRAAGPQNNGQGGERPYRQGAAAYARNARLPGQRTPFAMQGRRPGGLTRAPGRPDLPTEERLPLQHNGANRPYADLDHPDAGVPQDPLFRDVTDEVTAAEAPGQGHGTGHVRRTRARWLPKAEPDAEGEQRSVPRVVAADEPASSQRQSRNQAGTAEPAAGEPLRPAPASRKDVTRKRAGAG